MKASNFGKKSLIGASLLTAVLCLTGCDYVPHKTYEIQTKSGEIIKLSCPTLDIARSSFTYLYDKECYLVP